MNYLGKVDKCFKASQEDISMPKQSASWIKPPQERVLQVFAFDPSLNLDIEMAVLNSMFLHVPWEKLSIGPVGEYLEVVDIDPPSGSVYLPVDLDNPVLLVQDGLAPSEGTPQFHQQMVYAVVSRTIQNFERALGRLALWSPSTEGGNLKYVQRLRLYPHALREANAYYHPAKKAILFGYFPASIRNAGANLPGGMVFTCLSHDIIVHETTHALLDGLHPYFGEPSNPDVLALHEAFADIVALFQHFSYPEILRNQIAKTRGDLTSENLLAELAQQFGQAMGGRGALRSAIGKKEEDGSWKRSVPDPSLIQTTFEPHKRGSILVAAIFDAFLTVYQSRTADLLRIATAGSGILPAGNIHPDLVNRLADEAARISQHILNMCIRALDYCPPVDITFGEYLRAVITADYDLARVDKEGYRIALIESFRRHGIYPSGVRNLSEESLLWHPPEDELFRYKFFAGNLAEIRKFSGIENRYGVTREGIFNYDLGFRQIIRDFWFADLAKNATQKELKGFRKSLHLYLSQAKGDNLASIVLENGLPALEVTSVRPAYRIGQNSLTVTDLVVEVHQSRRGYLDSELQRKVDNGELHDIDPDFIFRGGATFLISTETGETRYVIGKRVGSNNRLERQQTYLRDGVVDHSLQATYFGNPITNYFIKGNKQVNLFAILHRSGLNEDV